MKYTIIITVYNKEKYIEKSILSVLNQTYNDYELIVVDDGSTDKSSEVIKKIKKKYNFKYYKKENTGVSDTRNYAIDKVNTEYFMFLDADDYLDKNILIEAEKYNDYDILSFNGINITEDNSFIRNIYKPPFQGDGKEFFKELVINKNVFTVPWGYIYKTEYFKKHKFKYPKGKILEDYFLTPFTIIEASKIISIDYCGYYYIDSKNSITQGNKEKIGDTYLNHYEVMNKLCEKYDNETKKYFKSFLAETLMWYASILDGKYKRIFIKKLKKDKIVYMLNKKWYKKIKINIFYSLNLYYPIRNIFKILIDRNKLDAEYYFYGEEKICNSLAYILNLYNYKIVNDIKKYDNKLIICSKNKDIKRKIKKEKLKYRKDYIYINEVYRIMNKQYIRRINWIPYRFYLNKKNIINIINIIRPRVNDIKLIKKIDSINDEYLKESELFIKVINDTQKNIKCNKLEKSCYIDFKGEMWGCCPGWTIKSFGNIQSKYDEYNSYCSNILKLSSINKTYTFCNFDQCIFYKPNITKENVKYKKLNSSPEEITIAIDKACNLKCKSCRKHIDTKTKDTSIKLAKIIEKTDWLRKSKVILAGQGEVFLSKVYKDLLFNKIKNNKIRILSNGTLLNKDNMEKLKEKYKTIEIEISVDAATETTYKYLRGGNFKTLKSNLKMIGEERKIGKVEFFQLNFCVQRDNYKEMKDFIKLGKSIYADCIQFTRLADWNTYEKEIYHNKSMIDENDILDYELYKEFKSKIFQDKIVDKTGFSKLIEQSDIYYRNKEK